ncbi:MAG: tetratricopeptide repeat protein [Ignavibacteria bacterium]
MIPNGIVTFLFTDIEGSTRLAQQFPLTLPHALEKHNSILNEAIASHNGFVFDIIGDAFCSAFENADDAVKAAVKMQNDLASEKWIDAVIKIRIGIHSGPAEWSGSGYMGYITLARAQRVMSAAYGEQIIVSDDADALIKKKIKASNLPLTNERGEVISFRDLGERRLKDMIQSLKLYQVVSHGLREDFPPLKTLDARPNNLPVQLTSFIGREKEMSDVKHLLSGTRLLSLIGPGGTGKTRIALQTAAESIDDYENGVWFVELASLTDPSHLPELIMKSIGIKEQQNKTSEETLCDHLKDKEILILLDNCEHLIDPSARISEILLQYSPGLKIIVTSRESLRIDGEQTHSVLPLAFPDPKDNSSPEQLSQYESVRLFIERALAVDQRFRVNNDNAPALAQICFHLDGIPLAIELAAARISVLSPEKINERLSDRFRLLTGGKRTALPRQQTLKALIDWSYDLLSEKEKIFWQRLSVFSGGWTLEAAEEICSDDDLSADDILDLMNELTGKSIIIYAEAKDRYSMLETMRRYGDEKLNNSGEQEKIRTDHLNYFLKTAETARTELFGPKAKEWLDKFESEHSNLRAALTWSLEKKLFEQGAGLVCALDDYWEARGYGLECGVWLEKFMSNPGSLSPDILARSNRVAGLIEKYKGNSIRSNEFFESSLKIYRELGDIVAASGVLNSLGVSAYNRGEYNTAEKYLEESLQLSRETGSKKVTSTAINSIGLIALVRLEFDKAKKYFEETVETAKSIGDEFLTGVGLNNLAVVQTFLGDYEEAEKLYYEVLKINKDLGNKIGIARTLSNLGNIIYLRNDLDKAESILNESLALSKEIGQMARILDALSNLGQVALSKGEIDTARSLFTESLNLQKELPDFDMLISGLNGMSAVKLYEGKPGTAARMIGAIQLTFESSGASMETSDRLIFEKTLIEIKKLLGEEKTHAEITKGRELSLEDAVEMALSED